MLDFVCTCKIPGYSRSFQEVFVTRFLCHTCFSVFFAENAYLDILSHVLRVKCKPGILIFAFNCSQWSNLGSIFKTSLYHNIMQSQQFSPKQKFKEFSRSFQAVSHQSFPDPSKSKIEFQGFSRTSRSSTDPI